MPPHTVTHHKARRDRENAKERKRERDLNTKTRRHEANEKGNCRSVQRGADSLPKSAGLIDGSLFVRFVSSCLRVHSKPELRVFAPSRFRVLFGTLMAVSLLAALGAGVAIMRARRSTLPPLLAWEGPEAASPSRATEARLAEAVRRTPEAVAARG